MATISGTQRPAYAWDAESNAWIPIGMGPHSHATTDVTGLATALAPYTTNINVYVADSSTARTVASATDIYNIVTFSSSSAVTVTVPSDTADSGFPVGSWLIIRQMGTGQITVAAGSGATVIATDNQLKTRVRYSEIALEKTSANTWLVAGDTAA
jgi:hypothetical protein